MRKKYLILLCCISVLLSNQCVWAEPNTTQYKIMETVDNSQKEVKKDRIEYIYEIREGKLYKRLYNYSRGEWVGDWILCK